MGKQASRVRVVKNQAGEIITEQEGVRSKWLEHFKQLYNPHRDIDDTVFSQGTWSKNSWNQITNLRFAADISLLAESEGELQHLVNRVSQTSTRFGVIVVSKPKCSVLVRTENS